MSYKVTFTVRPGMTGEELETLVGGIMAATGADEQDCHGWLTAGWVPAPDWEAAKTLALRLEDAGLKPWVEAAPGLSAPPLPPVFQLIGTAAQLTERGTGLILLALFSALLGLAGSTFSWGPLLLVIMIYFEGGLILAADEMIRGRDPGWRESLRRVDRHRYWNLFGATLLLGLPLLVLFVPPYLALDENTPLETVSIWVAVLALPALIYSYYFFRTILYGPGVILVGFSGWKSLVFSHRLTGLNQPQAFFRLAGLGTIMVLLLIPEMMMDFFKLWGSQVVGVVAETVTSIFVTPAMVLLFHDLRFRIPPVDPGQQPYSPPDPLSLLKREVVFGPKTDAPMKKL